MVNKENVCDGKKRLETFEIIEVRNDYGFLIIFVHGLLGQSGKACGLFI